jgi:hypothetical protein
MNDEVREMIARALDGEPPIGIDYESVRAAGRRRLTRRHLGVAAGAALGVVLVASTAVTVSHLAAAPPPAGQTGSPPATTVSTSAPAEPGCVMPKMTGGFSDPPSGTASPEALAEAARLNEAFGRMTLPLPAGVTMDPAKPKLCAITNSWGATFTLRSPAGERLVLLEVKPRFGQQPNSCGPADPHVRCATHPIPGGVGLITEDKPATTSPSLVYATAWRADDTIVTVGETGGEGAHPTPRILSDDAMIAIATAPELKVTWSGPARPAAPTNQHAAELTAAFAKEYQLPQGFRARKIPSARVDALSFFVSQGGYKLNADLVDAKGEGNLFIDLWAPVTVFPSNCPAPLVCEQISLPDGRKAMFSTQTDHGVTTLSLTTATADGSGVAIMSRNQSARAAASSSPTRATPPLGRDDLITIASLAGLRW